MGFRTVCACEGENGRMVISSSDGCFTDGIMTSRYSQEWTRACSRSEDTHSIDAWARMDERGESTPWEETKGEWFFACWVLSTTSRRQKDFLSILSSKRSETLKETGILPVTVCFYKCLSYSANAVHLFQGCFHGMSFVVTVNRKTRMRLPLTVILTDKWPTWTIYPPVLFSLLATVL